MTASDPRVVPVVLVTAELRNNPISRSAVLSRVLRTMSLVQGWYFTAAGKTFELADVVVVDSARAVPDWLELSRVSDAIPSRRFDYATSAYDEVVARMRAPKDGDRYVVFVATGDSGYGEWLGAAALFPYAVVAPDAAATDCEDFGDTMCARIGYAIAHELGHTLGLGHSCDRVPRDPRCEESVMQTNYLPNAIFTDAERVALLAEPILRNTQMPGIRP